MDPFCGKMGPTVRLQCSDRDIDTSADDLPRTSAKLLGLEELDERAVDRAANWSRLYPRKRHDLQRRGPC